MQGMPIVIDAGFPGSKYTWSNGASTQKITVTKTGTYIVTVDAGPNCMDIDTIDVQVDPLPSADGISYIKSGNNTYSFSPSNPQNSTGILWIFGDGTTSTQQNITKTINADLYVRMVLFNPCGTDTTQLGWPLSVSNVSDQSEITLYPNPANQNITVGTGNFDVTSITIVNSVGSVVSRPTITKGAKNITIGVSALPSGYYMMQIRTTEGSINKPFNIVR